MAPRLLGTDREVELLRPAGNDGYKELGKDGAPGPNHFDLWGDFVASHHQHHVTSITI